MENARKSLSVTVERTIAALPEEVFDAWLNPKTPGTPWSQGDKLILDPRVDGCFYWLIHEIGHFGRFTILERGARLQHTWMSRNTEGEESLVTVTFRKKGHDTLMSLVHTGLPDSDPGRSHEGGWSYFMDLFLAPFAERSAGR